MSKFHDLLHLRFKSKETSKMTELVERSNRGDLSSFSGVFRVSSLKLDEEKILIDLLQAHKSEAVSDIDADLKALIHITSEVKAITNQAVILHGERIQKAQILLKKYKEGAFTAWLFATYGNRQTPYNFLQYYEFYTLMPQELHPTIDQMPRQAIYTLASRLGPLEKKERLVRSYRGEAKRELLDKIRLEFPLNEEDQRAPNFALHAIGFLKRVKESLKNPLCVPSEKEKELLYSLLESVQQLIDVK